MTSQQTIDNLQYQKTQLVKQIHEAQRQLTSLDTQIFNNWITHTKERGNVTVSYGYPDQ